MAAFTLLLAACSGTDLDPPNPDAGTVAPDSGPDPVGAPLDGVVDPIADMNTTYAASLTDGTVLASGPAGLVRVRSSTVVSVGTAAGDVIDVVDLGNAALVAGSSGLFALVGDSLTRSPIQYVIGTVVPTDLLETPDGRVWIAGNLGLHAWRDGASVRVQANGLPDRDALLTYGAPIDGAPATWVAAGGRLYAVKLTNDAARAFPQALEADIRSLATASDQTLWIIERGGVLRSRRADGTWREHDVFSDGVRVVAADDGAVWLQTMQGLWRHHDGEFREVRGVPTSIHEASIDGSILAGTDRLVRVYPELGVRFEGIDEGSLLVVTTNVSIKPLLPERVTSLVVTLDGTAIDVGSAPWVTTIDPTTLADGTHTIEAIATYDDGATVMGSLRFSFFAGPVPNWTDDVQPLFDANCALCHGELGSARRLETFESWRGEIDLILFNVREGRMPLMPNRLLTAEEIGLIEGWAAAEFPIDGE